VGSSDFVGYCSFTKAIEHLGDRWTLLIVRELGVFGPQGFNDLVVGLPGRISRSVLSERLRRLETLGLVVRADRGARAVPYRLTSAGESLLPVIMSLRGWAAEWMPEDPTMVDRDPDVLLAWLGRRADPSRLPAERVVVELRTGDREQTRYWLVLQQGAAPYGCLTDPLLEEQRYLHVLAGPEVLLTLATGRRSWRDALGDGAVLAYGDPDLLEGLPSWFRPAEPRLQAGATVAPDPVGLPSGVPRA